WLMKPPTERSRPPRLLFESDSLFLGETTVAPNPRLSSKVKPSRLAIWGSWGSGCAEARGAATATRVRALAKARTRVRITRLVVTRRAIAMGPRELARPCHDLWGISRRP